MFLDNYGVTFDQLLMLSYKTNLNKSLKNTLRKFHEKQLFEEIEQIIEFYWSSEVFEELQMDYRIKSLQSCELKYRRCFPSQEVYRVFNDLLGFRIIGEYDSISSQDLSKFRVVNMTTGKAIDDGYRGIHLYFQESKYHYPIEFQINSHKDRVFNDWLHIDVYKYVVDAEVGAYLRKLYEDGIITNEKEFKEVLDNVLFSGQEI